MKNMKTTICLLATMFIGAAVLPSARADEWNKKTQLTFSQSVEVPGKILPAGTYTFKLLDSPADRHIVQIFDADGTHLITTVMAINNYRLKPTGETVIKFSEQPADAPEALKAWFYPGDNFGQEFVYPKKRAIELAQASKSVVPSSEASEESSMRTAPVTAYNSEEKEVEVNKEIQTSPSTEVVTTSPAPATTVTTPAPSVESHEAHNRTELPQTGSSMPLIALLGALSLSFAFALKLFVKCAS